jgi:hypothetical protein
MRDYRIRAAADVPDVFAGHYPGSMRMRGARRTGGGAINLERWSRRSRARDLLVSVSASDPSDVRAGTVRVSQGVVGGSA